MNPQESINGQFKKDDVVSNLDDSTWGFGRVITLTKNRQRARVEWPDRIGTHGPVEGYIELSKLNKISAAQLLADTTLEKRILNEHYGRILSENGDLRGMLLEMHQEAANFRNEIKWLKEQLTGKPMVEREELLLRVAKEIVRELDKPINSN